MYVMREKKESKENRLYIDINYTVNLGYGKYIIITKQYQVNSGHSLLNSLQPFRVLIYYSVIRTTYLLYTGNMQCSGF